MSNPPFRRAASIRVEPDEEDNRYVQAQLLLECGHLWGPRLAVARGDHANIRAQFATRDDPYPCTACERNEPTQSTIEQAVAAEREACAALIRQMAYDRVCADDQRGAQALGAGANAILARASSSNPRT